MRLRLVQCRKKRKKEIYDKYMNSKMKEVNIVLDII